MSFPLPFSDDLDPQETREWLQSLEQVARQAGSARAGYLVAALTERARALGIAVEAPLVTDYVNTIAPEDEPEFPGDEWMEKRIRRIVRWNAMAMVARANRAYLGIGGHLSSYASSASLYEVGFNHFFRGRDEGSTHGGDQIYFQGHAAPGIYARAFLEGRLGIGQLERFRRETEFHSRPGAPAAVRGLSSYPHPRLMPDFWEFPTVSMGLGPLSAIYQARFNRYLQDRGILDTSSSRVWCFLGDGESDEPEALGALSVAARERLDNLTFVVNCNLQRLDGPVRGNGKIIQELEAVFRGSGWNVIKVIWGRQWDPLLARDDDGVLRRRMNEVVDGQWQKYVTEDGAYIRRSFSAGDPRLVELVSALSDSELHKLRRGGHDIRKLYAAYKRAVEHQGQPTAILAHTVKGWALGHGFEARNATHQIKKLTEDELKAFRDLLQLPIPDSQVEEAPFYHPGADSPEVEYLHQRRRALGGFVPARRVSVSVPLVLPLPSAYEEFQAGTKVGDGASTTSAFVRLLARLLKDESIGKRIVPIIPDEARTFGMESLFRSVGIYSSRGQLYEPVDKGMLLYYREAVDGQVLEEGITEAGSLASFTAAATAHASHGEPMIPFYIFYSMFGFQRVGDLIWAMADARGRGFLLGATAGRTTLNGEGLQHQDGHSHAIAATVPSALAYDPAFAYEVAVIVEDGLRRMIGQGEDVFYYLTLQNETYPMPAMPEGSREGILAGLYRFRAAESRRARHVELFGSGSILNQVLRAQELLAGLDVSADVWSATSYNELRKDALAVERHNRLHPGAEPRRSYLERALHGVSGPFIAASDYTKSGADGIARWLPGRLVALGTDGFGMSDTRAALRRHFEIDAESVAIAALDALRAEGKATADEVARAIAALNYDADKRDPMSL